MPIQKLLAKIHIAKKELGLDDDLYREVLFAQCGVRSSRDLDNRRAIKLLRYFEEKGWQPHSRKPKKYDDQKGDIYSATPKQKRLIEVLWHNIYRGNDETKHLRQFLWNHFKVSDVRFLDKDKAGDVIEALKAMQGRRHAA